MHLSDDESVLLRQCYVASNRSKKTSKKITIKNIGFLIVLIIFEIIYYNLKTKRGPIKAMLYNKNSLQIISESLHESRRFRAEVMRNRSISPIDGVTMSMDKYPPGMLEAGYHVFIAYQDIVNQPISKLKLNHNLSNEFYETNGGMDFYDTFQWNKIYNNSITTCKGKDWINCNGFHCRVTKEIFDKMPFISCDYSDIVYIDNNHYYIGNRTTIDGNEIYCFEISDHVKVTCNEFGNIPLPIGIPEKEIWSGLKTGFRPIRFADSGPRKKTLNVLILALDSIPYDKFHNYLPNAFRVLTRELKAVLLQNYNVNNSDMSTAFHIKIKKSGLKLPEEQVINRNIYLYPDNFLFTLLHKDAYYTAYFSDCPMVSSKSYKFLTNYRLNHFFEENDNMSRADRLNTPFSDENCVGDTPKYALLMRITQQYTLLPGKRFSFTLISNITTYRRWEVEENLIKFLRFLKGNLKDTLFIFMTNQIFSKPSKSTSSVEDLNQLVFIALPDQLIEGRPGDLEILKGNKDIFTTPFDIDMTILDAVGLDLLGKGDNVTDFKVPRGRSLLKIPRKLHQYVTSNPVPPTL